MKHGDRQMTAMGLLSYVTIMSVSMAKPLDQLSAVRPLNSIFHPVRTAGNDLLVEKRKWVSLPIVNQSSHSFYASSFLSKCVPFCLFFFEIELQIRGNRANDTIGKRKATDG